MMANVKPFIRKHDILSNFDLCTLTESRGNIYKSYIGTQKGTYESTIMCTGNHMFMKI